MNGILALGPKFSVQPSPNEPSLYHYLTDIENILSCHNNNNTININRAKITNLITNWVKEPQPDNFIKKNFIQTKLFLKNHSELVITLSDKGKNCNFNKKSI